MPIPMDHATSPEPRANIIAVAILGTDTMMAALPATPVQLAHACLHAGYALAIPASWGDELVAAECLRQLAERGPRPAVMCACPHVRQELLSDGSDLAPMLVPLVAPPVAVARYLHALYGRDRLHLTYVGRCPAGSDQSIDEQCAPADFLSSLANAGIDPGNEPRFFDSVIPPDRRRFFSVAGGLPSAERLWSEGNGRSLVELDDEDYRIALAQHLLSHECALIDLAPRLGCACSGASTSVPARSARAAVAVVEPPRAASTVVDVTMAIDLVDPIMIDVHAESVSGGRESSPGDWERARQDIWSRSIEEYSPPVVRTPVLAKGADSSYVAGSRSIRSGVPLASVGGRALPRAYVAARKSVMSSRSRPEASKGEPVVSRVPPANPIEPIGDENGRSRVAARVASAPRSRQHSESPASIAAAAAGAPDMMGDGPRS